MEHEFVAHWATYFISAINYTATWFDLLIYRKREGPMSELFLSISECDAKSIEADKSVVQSSDLLNEMSPAVAWAMQKNINAPKSGAFAIRNHAFSSGAPKSGAFAIRNHAFSAEVPKSGAFAIRNHAFSA